MQQTKTRCENFKLARSSNVANDLKVFPSSGVIKVKEKSFKILRTRGDGNCQFRAISILVTGADKEINHKKLRILSVREFMKIEDGELKKSLCFTHDPRDCITAERCTESKVHEGAFLQASTPPFRRFVLNKEEFAKEMSKDKTWGNEYTVKSLALAMDLKINVFQQGEGTQSFRVLSYNSVSDCELNLLYNGSHFEALLPVSEDRKMTGENSPQSIPSDLDSDSDSGEPLSKRKRKGKFNSTAAVKNKKCGAKRAKTKSKLPSFQDWYNKDMKKARQAETNINTVMEDVDDIDLTGASSMESKSDSEERQQKQTETETGHNSPHSTSPISGSGCEDADCNGNMRIKQKEAPIGIVDQKDGNDKIEMGITGKEENYNETVKIMKTKTKQASIRAMFAPQLTPNSFIHGENAPHVEEKVSKLEDGEVETEDRGGSNDDQSEPPADNSVQGVKKRSRACVVNSEWFQPNGLKDSTGVVVNSYLRRVVGSRILVNCSLCEMSFSVQYKGVSAINRHATSKKHVTRIEEVKSNKDMGAYVEKNREDNVIDAEIKLTKWAGIHNISLRTTLPHLVKLLKTIFPDSPICQEMSDLNRSRLYYGMKFGLGKSEIDTTVKDLQKTPFSLSMDGGMKGGKHRINYIVRYFCEESGKCVEKVILSRTTVNETASLVASLFLDWCTEFNLDIKKQLIMINSDHAAVLRGSKTGAVVRIGEKAPNVLSCDIGGDCLHDLNNSTKAPFYATFPSIVKLLDITRQHFNKSCKEEAKKFEVCSEQGLPTTKPQVWVRSRFLSRFASVKERRKRIHAYSEYFQSVEAKEEPRRKKRRVQEDNISGEKSPQAVIDDNEQSSDSEFEDPEADIKKPTKAKKLLWLKKYLDPDEGLQKAIVELDVAIDCLSSSDILLKVFQCQKPMIHVLKPTILEYVRDCFREIIDVKYLKYSDGKPLGGSSLKALQLESEEDRLTRREEDRNIEKKIKEKNSEKMKMQLEFESSALRNDEKQKYNHNKRMEKMDKEEEKLRDKLSNGRFATVFEPKQVTLSSTVKETIKSLYQTRCEGQEMEMHARELKLEFYLGLCKKIQQSLPLDNALLSKIVYIDPAKLNDDKTEKKFMEICEQMPGYIGTEKDEVISDYRKLRLNQADMGKDYEKYLEEVKDDDILFKDKLPIDMIWSPIIKKKNKYPSLGKFLKAVLSFTHSTASVEGSIKDMRNVLGSMSHASSDLMCSSRLAIMTSVRRGGTSNCCYDFQCNKDFRTDWLESYKTQEKALEKAADPEDIADSGENDSDNE